MKFPSGRVLVFCKAPVPGQVKTRLAAEIGDEAACRLHERLATRMVEAAMNAGLAPVELWCDPDGHHPFFARFALPSHAQQGDDIGERMAFALASALSDQNVDRAVLVGTDCPSIDDDYLRQALAALENHDAVLGPAEDGGYGLIGLRRPAAGVFEGVSWGTDKVASTTCERFTGMGLSYELLETIWDVDRPADLARLRRRTPT